MSIAIDCQKLSKRYGRGDDFALKNLDLQVNTGEIYGFLGPNGAGKSTAIRTLLNFIQPTSGSATILGQNVVKDSVKAKRQVGYLAGEVALYPRMTGRQFLNYMTDLQPLKHPDYQQKLVKQFGAQLDKPIEELSKGNRQKIGIIQAFMHEPDVLILDEPTSGLDPLMQAAFYELAESAKQRGAAVFLSSHDLTEVRKMCDRIGFIRGGKLVAEKTIADLQAVAAHNFDITFKGSAPLEELRELKDAEVQPVTDNSVIVKLQGDLTPLFALLAKSSVLSLDKQDINLDEEFMSLYKGPKS
ncbi:MAG TPA: ABC transporter ATP-binding protein [Methylomirabilota bacterium]|nr:ABC transporter ATP-binding protein [Methylomirabilota bacterium]